MPQSEMRDEKRRGEKGHWLLVRGTHMAVHQPVAWVISHHVCVHLARGKDADLVSEAPRVVKHHAMPVGSIKRISGLISTQPTS